MPAETAVDLENFTRSVVPLLQDRGLFHRSYPVQQTLRERLGLDLPTRRPVAQAIGEPGSVSLAS